MVTADRPLPERAPARTHCAQPKKSGQPGGGPEGAAAPWRLSGPGAPCPSRYAQPVPRQRTAGPPGLSTVVSDAIS